MFCCTKVETASPAQTQALGSSSPGSPRRPRGPRPLLVAVVTMPPWGPVNLTTAPQPLSRGAPNMHHRRQGLRFASFPGLPCCNWSQEHLCADTDEPDAAASSTTACYICPRLYKCHFKHKKKATRPQVVFHCHSDKLCKRLTATCTCLPVLVLNFLRNNRPGQTNVNSSTETLRSVKVARQR